MTDTAPYIRSDDPPGKALILRQGLRLFARQGLAATSIRDIADAAGLSNPALYKHFRSKDALALELFERIYRNHFSRLVLATGQPADFTGRFRAFLAVRLKAIDEAPDASIFASDNLAALWPGVSADMKTRTMLSLLREILKDGAAAGQIDARANMALQIALVVGALEHLTRQAFFAELPGPASDQLDELDQRLRAALR